MMRALLVIAMFGACHIDPTTLPDCLSDNDCYSGGHCVQQSCVEDEPPIAVTDVFYSTIGDVTVQGNVIANDMDPEGDPLTLVSVTGGFVVDDQTAKLTIGSQADYTYVVDDGRGYYGTSMGHVQILQFPAERHYTVASNGSVAFDDLFQGIDPTHIELVTPPMHGVVTDHTYQPALDYCGTDSVTYRLHGDNDPIDVTATFATVLPLANDTATAVFGSTQTLDVLANDGVPGLTITAVNDAGFGITANGDALVVTPPVGAAATYSATYTARDSRGCEGTAIVSLAVQFPTQVIVGSGLAGDSFDPSMSDDGRFIAFTSSDATLVANDTNNAADIFVLDRSNGSYERVSVSSNGTQSNNESTSPSISADGRYVTFVSKATNLAPADTSAAEDVYVHDRTTGITQLVSVTLDGTGSTQPALTPDISDDGNRIVFVSSGPRFVANDTNGVADVFVRDLAASTTTRVSLDANANQEKMPALPRPRISGDGRYVVYRCDSYIENGVGYNGGSFIAELSTSNVTALSVYAYDVDVDTTGRHVAYYAPGGMVILDQVVDATTTLNGDTPVLTPDARCSATASGNRIYGQCGESPISLLVDASGMSVQALVLRRPAITADGHWVVFATNDWPGEQGHYVLVRVWNTAAM